MKSPRCFPTKKIYRQTKSPSTKISNDWTHTSQFLPKQRYPSSTAERPTAKCATNIICKTTVTTTCANTITLPSLKTSVAVSSKPHAVCRVLNAVLVGRAGAYKAMYANDPTANIAAGNTTANWALQPTEWICNLPNSSRLRMLRSIRRTKTRAPLTTSRLLLSLLVYTATLAPNRATMTRVLCWRARRRSRRTRSYPFLNPWNR